MGAGNFIPWNPRDCNGDETLACKFFYIAHSEDIEAENQPFFYDDLMKFIAANVPKSFVKSRQRNSNRYESSLFENELVEIGAGDNEWSICIFIRELETDLPCRNFASRYVDRIYKSLVRLAIKRGYKLYKRTSSWTSEIIS